MKRVVIVQRVLTQYRVPFFEALRTNLSRHGVELHLVHGQPDEMESAKSDSGTLGWATRVRNRYVRFGSRSLCWQPVTSEVKGCDLVIVEQASRLLINYLLLASPQYRRRVAFWGHGRNLDAERSSAPAEWIKAKLIKAPNWWFAYTDSTVAYLTSMGVSRGRVTAVQNSIDLNDLKLRRAQVANAETLEFRRSLGAGPADPVLVVLGSLYSPKRVAFTLEVADILESLVDNVHVVFVGDGPDAGLVRSAARTRRWVHFVGRADGDDLARVCSASSLLLNPGLVGLVALDSFALELPIVTCKLASHSPEFDYLQDGENAVVLPGDATALDFATRISELLRSPHEVAMLREGCRRSSTSYGIDAMVERFAAGIHSALSRRT